MAGRVLVSAGPGQTRRYFYPDRAPIDPDSLTDEEKANAIPDDLLYEAAMGGSLASPSANDLGTGVLDPLAVVPPSQRTFRDRQRALSAQYAEKRAGQPEPQASWGEGGGPLSDMERAANRSAGELTPAEVTRFHSLTPWQQQKVNERRAIDGLPPMPPPPVTPIEPKKQPVVPMGPPAASGGGSVRVGVPIGPFTEAKGKLEAFEKAQRGLAGEAATLGEQAANSSRDVANAMAEHELEAARKRTGIADRFQAEQARKRAAMTDIMDKHYADLDRMSAEAASMTVDPSRFWVNRSTGDKVIATVSMLLGAAAARPGEENPAMKVLRQAIEDDIDAQKANIGQKNIAVGQKRNFIYEVRQKYADEDQQDAAARIAALSLVNATMAEMAAAQGGPLARANYLKAQAELKKWQLAQEQQLGESLADEWVKLASARGELSVRAQTANAANQPGEPYDWAQHGLMRIGQGPISPQAAQQAIDGTAAAEMMRSALDNLIKQRNSLGWFDYLFPTEKAAAGTPHLVDLKASYSKWQAMGAFDKGTETLMNEMLGAKKINDWGWIEERLKQFRRRIDTVTNRKLGKYGFIELPSRVEAPPVGE